MDTNRKTLTADERRCRQIWRWAWVNPAAAGRGRDPSQCWDPAVVATPNIENRFGLSRSILAVDRFYLRKSAFICGLSVFCLGSLAVRKS
jgi:hypothetical protein